MPAGPLPMAMVRSAPVFGQVLAWDWVPPLASFGCMYARSWIDVKWRYQLTADPAEKDARYATGTDSARGYHCPPAEPTVLTRATRTETRMAMNSQPWERPHRVVFRLAMTARATAVNSAPAALAKKINPPASCS